MNNKSLLIDEAYKMLTLAKAGNCVSATVFEEWAEANGMPSLTTSEYDKVNTYQDFYNVCYYYIFGN